MKVLIAEDNATERLLLWNLVDALGHECVAASDGEQAWAMFQQDGADVLISDWMMPGLDGPELCRRVRAHPGVPYTYIVLLTVLDDQAHSRAGMQAGADDYLRKPPTIEQLDLSLIAAARITELHRQLSRREVQRQRALERREAVLRLAQQLTAEGDPERFLAGLLAEAAVLLGGTAGVVSLWDEEHGVLVPVRNTIPTVAGDTRPAAGQAASARAIERRARVVLNDYEREAGDEEAGAQAAVAAPLVHAEQLVGAIAVVTHLDEKSFTPEDAELLQQVADVGAAALVGLGRARLEGALSAVEGLQQEATQDGSAAPSATGRRLPAQPMPLLGRDAELTELGRLLLGAEVNLVTLTGPAGVGKTRLAVAVADQIAESFEHGVWFVDLSAISSPGQVLTAITEALGLRITGLEPLRRTLCGRRSLLVLDNFEHVLAAGDLVGDVLASCPSVTVLVTSRAPLHLRSEQVFPVQPLPVPRLRGRLELEAIEASPAVALFVQRARAAQPNFSLNEEAARSILEICARLDGLPLAIELAAARTSLLTPKALLARLQQQGLDVLSNGSRDLPERQQTLREAMAWSYALLDPDEQRVFRSLAVFEGGVPLDGAERLLEAGAGRDEPRRSALQVLSGLVDKSLLMRNGAEAEPRFRLLATIREYARELLQARGEFEAARRRHAEFFLELAERADAELTSSHQVAWLDRLEREHDNLRAALRFAIADDRAPDMAARLSAALARFWYLRGYWQEGWESLERAAAADRVSARSRAGVLGGAAALAGARGEWARARSLAVTGLAVARELDDAPRTAEMLAQLAFIAQRMSERSAALTFARESMALARQLQEPWALARALHAQGEIALGQGNGAGARKHFSECLRLAEQAGIASFLPVALEGLAAVAAARGQSERALRLAGGADALRSRWRMPLTSVQRDLLERRLGPTRAALDDAHRTAAWADGHALSVQQLIADALHAEPARREPNARAEQAGLKWLTRREREVASLVADGLRNGEIADKLRISLNTVEVHMSNIMGKLGMDSRAQLAVWAAEQGLLDSAR
jgi:non-specific serine/threonine protein kinase